MPLLRASSRIMLTVVVIAAATAAALAARANAITVGYVYLVAVLLLAVWGGLRVGIAASLAATVCFNYFFLPPVGTLHIADAENWVALFAFLLAATIASRLVARERQRAIEADDRRREIAALYELSLDLFTANATPAALDQATARALSAMGARSGGFVMFEADGQEAWVGSPAHYETHRLLADSPAPFPQLRVPVEVGGRAVGELVAYGSAAPGATIDAVARLVGLAVERERLLAERARLQGIEESDALKTALLRAVSHDLATPLTAIDLHVAALARHLRADAEGAATLQRLAEASHRLERRIEGLLAMARLEAGRSEPRREPSPAADLFRAAREHAAQLAPERRIEARVEPGCPDLDVDPSLVVEILANLIDNAHRASPAGAVIELAAASSPGAPARVWLDVLDAGHGLGATHGSAESASRRGLGLEIARTFAAAHGGSVTLVARQPCGVRARVELPAAAAAEASA